MPIDFNALFGGASPDTALRPQEIFSLLPEKSRKYQYLRDVQGAVLSDWFLRRTESDLVLKMNTGSGKTVVGLLALKSCLNEKVGPAVYVAPTSYLVKQVKSEASLLGIETTEDVTSPRFQSGKAILLINIHKLINGKSVFGVGQEGVKIGIGCIVVDDAHTCLSASEEQFTLEIPATDGAFTKLFDLFESDLSQQSEATASEIKERDPNKQMLVPFWAWLDKHSEILKILQGIKDQTSVKFAWPLLSETLLLSRCVFSGRGLEITPHCLPIDVIPSFTQAKRRLFMTAALADDGVLVTDYNVPVTAVGNPISPPTAGDIGDRMILVPQEADPTITDGDIKALVSEKAKAHNVVVLVPSERRAQFWADAANRTITAANLADGVEELKGGHIGLAVLVNKYDGIDLPDEACRLLVIDGLPDQRRQIERIEQVVLRNSGYVVARSIQRIEQGMGRGIRSNEDYCAVLLMGSSLTATLYADGAIEKFTPATKAQMRLSGKLADQLSGQGIEAISSAIDQCLARNKQWVAASRSATVGSSHESQTPPDSYAINRRLAFNAAQIQQYDNAVEFMQKSVSDAKTDLERGWMMQQLAEYRHSMNPADAQEIQRKAVGLNKHLLRPIKGIVYARMTTQRFEQADHCIAYLRKSFENPNAFLIRMNALVDEVSFEPETSQRFERAIATVALILGFRGQTPESEAGNGPDVLWHLGGFEFYVIECKNGATSDKVNKRDCNQLGGSMNWFLNQYGPSCTATPILIHPSKAFEAAATPHPETRIITTGKLSLLQESLRTFATSVASLPNFGAPHEVANILHNSGLVPPLFLGKFTEKPRLGR